jgi:predicted DNA-binding transcriptional regulator YafY
MLAQERPPEERPAIERARKRLRQAIAKLPDQDLECGWLESAGPTGVDLDTIATLRKAIRERRVVRLYYQSGSATEPTWREVHPLGLIFHGGMWYLVADGGGEYRFFRADRIHSIQDQEEGFAPPAGFELDGLIGDRTPFTFSTREELIVRFSPNVARWVAERECRVVAADGSLTAQYQLGDEGWGVRFVLQYGTDAVLLGPDRARLRIRSELVEVGGGASPRDR